MGPRSESNEDYCFTTGIDSEPGLVIDVVVQVPDARRHFQCSFSVDRQDAQVFGPVLNEYPPQSQLFGNRGIDNQFRGASF